jgi:hypothetical protein
VKYTITTYVNHPKEALEGNFTARDSTQIRWFLEQSDGRLDLGRGGQRHLKLS